jgi:hypothetical protein
MWRMGMRKRGKSPLLVFKEGVGGGSLLRPVFQSQPLNPLEFLGIICHQGHAS